MIGPKVVRMALVLTFAVFLSAGLLIPSAAQYSEDPNPPGGSGNCSYCSQNRCGCAAPHGDCSLTATCTCSGSTCTVTCTYQCP